MRFAFMARELRWLFVAALCLPTGAASVTAQEKPSPHPRVLGFERFYAQGDSATPHAALEGGLLLLGELNCTSCHAAGDALVGRVVKKQAPILSEVGSRVRPEYLARFLANPQATKPGTTMPHVFAALPAEEAQAQAEALAHYLATTGKLTESRPSHQAALRGDQLYHSVGCVVCHGPRKDDAPAQAGSIPLGVPSKKYTFAGLSRFLEDPLHVRPSGRMPNPNLTPQQAGDIASYLLADLAGPSGLDYAYYEGTWGKLPDFSTLTPKASGPAEKIDITLRQRDDNFALRFDGLVELSKEGEYTFFVQSDDGARVSIDGRVVVDHDGIHPPSEKSGRVKLTAGKHAVTVEYFEQAGGEELRVELEGPDLKRCHVNEVLATPEPVASADAPQPWRVDAALAAKGKEIFATAGCASCHQLEQEGQALASSLKAPNLQSLKGAGGCLSEQPSSKSPHFAVSAAQRTAIAEALAAVQKPQVELSPGDEIHHNLVRFNCYGCHSRGEIGGVQEGTNAWFTTTMKEMGDEARIPPHLTLVGAKLRDEALKAVVEDGAKVRPYMLTHMPKFGAGNVGHLVQLLTTADAGKVPPAPQIDADEGDRRFKASGRFIVGAQGVGCIKCHTFNGKGTPGIQVMDLTAMTQRLRDDWYYHYMLNPPAYRPGTRMPAAWPGGQTVLPKVLEGDTAKQIRSTWAYLSDGGSAQTPVGMVEAAIEILPIDEPVIYRNFIEGAGPRGIAVGFPQKVNYAWDANHMRMALLWQGAFIDASMHWVGRGPGFQKPLGEPVAALPVDAPLAILPSANTEWPATTDRNNKDPNYKFLGYRLDKKRVPTFRYTFQGLTVEDRATPKAEGEIVMLARTLSFANSGEKNAGAVNDLHFLAAVGNKIEPAAEQGWYVIDGKLRVRIDAAAAAIMRQSRGRQELLVPVKFSAGRSQIGLEYEW
jgi:mono/diheme cytochrome c family protein